MAESAPLRWARKKQKEKVQRELKKHLEDMRQELVRLKAEAYDLQRAGLNGPASKRLPGLIERLEQNIQRVEQQLNDKESDQ